MKNQIIKYPISPIKINSGEIIEVNVAQMIVARSPNSKLHLLDLRDGSFLRQNVDSKKELEDFIKTFYVNTFLDYLKKKCNSILKKSEVNRHDAISMYQVLVQEALHCISAGHPDPKSIADKLVRTYKSITQ